MRLIALLLILFPVRLPIPTHWPAMVQALKEVSIRAELASPGVEIWTDSATNELRWSREKWRELWGLPSMVDSRRFPAHATCNNMENIACRRIKWLRIQGLIYRSRFGDSGEMIADAVERHRIWSDAETATNPKGHACCRRQALARLYEMIGPDDYYAGILPDP